MTTLILLSGNLKSSTGLFLINEGIRSTQNFLITNNTHFTHFCRL